MLGVTPRELLCNELHIPGELRLLAANELVQELLLRQHVLHHLLHMSRHHSACLTQETGRMGSETQACHILFRLLQTGHNV